MPRVITTIPASSLPLSGALNITTPEDEDQVGHLFFQTQLQPSRLPDTLPGNIPDNNILGTALALKEMAPEREVIHQALGYNPAFFNAIYTDLIEGSKDELSLQRALDLIDAYLSERAEHNLFTLPRPDRVVVDVRNSRLGERLATLPAGSGYVRGIRAAHRVH